MTDMTVKTPWHLWAVGVISLLWNGYGGYDFIMTTTQGETYMRAAGMTHAIIGREELAQCWRGAKLVVELLETAIHGPSDKTCKPAKAALVPVELVKTDTFLQIRGDGHGDSPKVEADG